MGRSPGSHMLAPTTATKKIDVGSPTGVTISATIIKTDRATMPAMMSFWFRGTVAMDSSLSQLCVASVPDIVLFRIPPEHDGHLDYADAAAPQYPAGNRNCSVGGSLMPSAVRQATQTPLHRQVPSGNERYHPPLTWLSI